MATDIKPGSRVNARDAFGQQLHRRAVSPVTMGHDFPVVWVAREDEWQAAQAEGREPEAVPWPAEDVTPSESADEDENEAGFRLVRDVTEE